MAKNLMPEVAALLDVEIGERFKLRINTCIDGNLYFFDVKNGLMCERNGIAYKERGSVFVNIILGDYAIVKLPWEPKYKEPYYRPNIIKKAVENNLWRGSTFNYAMKSLGMVYRTKAEAEAHFVEDYERLTGKPLSSR